MNGVEQMIGNKNAIQINMTGALVAGTAAAVGVTAFTWNKNMLWYERAALGVLSGLSGALVGGALVTQFKK